MKMYNRLSDYIKKVTYTVYIISIKSKGLPWQAEVAQGGSR